MYGICRVDSRPNSLHRSSKCLSIRSRIKWCPTADGTCSECTCTYNKNDLLTTKWLYRYFCRSFLKKNGISKNETGVFLKRRKFYQFCVIDFICSLITSVYVVSSAQIDRKKKTVRVFFSLQHRQKSGKFATNNSKHEETLTKRKKKIRKKHRFSIRMLFELEINVHA